MVTSYYCVAVVGIIVAGFDRLCMCDLGHDVPKMMVKCRNGVKQ